MQDACSAVAVSAAWAKAHWRKGVALKGLKRFPEAVQAFHQASVLLKGRSPPKSEVLARIFVGLSLDFCYPHISIQAACASWDLCRRSFKLPASPSGDLLLSLAEVPHLR